MIARSLASIPDRVRIVEVGPRDGLQNESTVLDTADKVRFIELLADSGLAHIEATSFVHPRLVPQLADAEELMAALPELPAVEYSALVPNRRGLDRALASGVKAIALFTAASETFNQRNVGMSIADSLNGFRDMIPVARDAGCSIRAYVSTAYHCPYEGVIKPDQVVPVVSALIDMGVDEVSIGDTIGHASPSDVEKLGLALARILPISQTAYHFHDTFGMALANVLIGLQMGVAVYDSSTGGAGGCPFAPGAAGNVATDDLVSMLDGMGVSTGVRLEGLLLAAEFLEAKLGRRLTSHRLEAKRSASNE